MRPLFFGTPSISKDLDGETRIRHELESCYSTGNRIQIFLNEERPSLLELAFSQEDFPD